MLKYVQEQKANMTPEQVSLLEGASGEAEVKKIVKETLTEGYKAGETIELEVEAPTDKKVKEETARISENIEETTKKEPTNIEEKVSTNEKEINDILGKDNPGAADLMKVSELEAENESLLKEVTEEAAPAAASVPAAEAAPAAPAVAAAQVAEVSPPVPAPPETGKEAAPDANA